MSPFDRISLRQIAATVFLLAFVAVIAFLVVQYFLDQRAITWRENAKIQDGMTQSEIESVLGSPHSVELRPNGGTTVRWIGRKQGMIEVEFDANGTMQEKLFVFHAIDFNLSFYPRAGE